MNDDVREIVARAVCWEFWFDSCDASNQVACWHKEADAILAALAEAGYAVVANELLDTVDAFLGPKCANVNDDAWIWGVPDSRDHDNIVLDMRFWLNYFWPGKRHSLSEETP